MFMKICISAIFILLTIAPLKAVEFRYTLFSNIRYSDNLNQTINEIEGYAINGGLTFNLSNEPDAEFSYVTSGLYGVTSFSQSGIKNQYVRGFNGNFLYQPKSSNFRFLAVENISQVPQNRFVTQEINNIRDVEVTAVKPSYFLNLSGADELKFDYSFIVVDAGTTNAFINAQNGSRKINEYSFSYDHNVNANNTVSIVGRRSSTNYDEDLNIINLTGVDYNQKDIFARWRLEGQSNLLRFDAGLSSVKTELGRKIDVNLLQFLYRRQINRSHSFSLTFRQGFDSIFNFELGTNNINVNNRSGDFGNTLKLNESRFSYDIEDDFITSRLSYFDLALDSALTTNTETRKGVDFRMVYRLSRLLDTPYDTNITFAYYKSKNKFDSNLTQVTDNIVERFNLFLNYYISGNTFLYVQLQKRDSDSFVLGTPNATIKSNSIFLGISYSPNGRVNNR